MPCKPYNGFRCAAAYYVHVAIMNKVHLYALAHSAKLQWGNADNAARSIMPNLPTHTESGHRFTITTVAEAIRAIKV
jgi:hypothetical protein